MSHGKVGIVFHQDKMLCKRGYKTEIASFILIIFFVCVGWYLEDITFILVGISELYLLSFCGCFLQNTSQLIEELSHLNSVRSSNIWPAICMTFSFNSLTIWFLIITLSLLINHGFMYGLTSILVLQKCRWESFICIYLAVIIWNKMININYSELNDKLMIEKMHGLDIGSGMAYSFFYGYLKLILPNIGTSCKGMKEKIADYEAINDVRFIVPKLFILVPSSMYISPTLQDISQGWMEPCRPLEVKEIDRAGIKSRPYKNSVYKMRRPNSRDKYVYIVVEGATPLKTLYDIMTHNTPCGKYYTLYYKVLIRQFFFTLCDLLQNDRDCADVCHVVYYNDIDETGAMVNVAEILLNIINTYNN